MFNLLPKRLHLWPLTNKIIDKDSGNEFIFKNVQLHLFPNHKPFCSNNKINSKGIIESPMCGEPSTVIGRHATILASNWSSTESYDDVSGSGVVKSYTHVDFYSQATHMLECYIASWCQFHT